MADWLRYSIDDLLFHRHRGLLLVEIRMPCLVMQRPSLLTFTLLGLCG